MAERILSCPFPSNLNPLSGNSFKFTIQKIPGVEYFLQEVTLPALSLQSPEQVNSLTYIPIPGDIITYDTLDISFMVDSKMENYKSIFNWIEGLGFPETNQQFADFKDQSDGYLYSDASLQILDSLGNVAATIQFVDCIPVSLSGLQFQSSTDDVQYLVGRASFRYVLYKFI